MARKFRLQDEGARYPVLNHGDCRESIGREDHDWEAFAETPGQCCARTGWQMHALCLKPNHFHMVVATPQPNLVAGMKRCLGVYTGRFNRRHQLFGHLFSGRY